MLLLLISKRVASVSPVKTSVQVRCVPLTHLSRVAISDELGQVRGGHFYIRVIPTVEQFLR